MNNSIDMLSDLALMKRISAKLKGLRLKQNMSRQELADSSGVSVSSIARIEDGEIKSFDSLLRIIRTLGQLGLLLPLLEEETMSPNEYLQMMRSTQKHVRQRASKSRTDKEEEDLGW